MQELTHCSIFQGLSYPWSLYLEASTGKKQVTEATKGKFNLRGFYTIQASKCIYVNHKDNSWVLLYFDCSLNMIYGLLWIQSCIINSGSSFCCSLRIRWIFFLFFSFLQFKKHIWFQEAVVAVIFHEVENLYGKRKNEIYLKLSIKQQEERFCKWAPQLVNNKSVLKMLKRKFYVALAGFFQLVVPFRYVKLIFQNSYPPLTLHRILGVEIHITCGI